MALTVEKRLSAFLSDWRELHTQPASQPVLIGRSPYGLRRFLAEWRRLRDAAEASTPAFPDRLRRFIAHYKINTSKVQTVKRSYTVDVSRLSSCLKELGPGLREAKKAGHGFNVWAVAGLGREEVRTCAVLAWLLNPHGSHGSGTAYAEALWRSIGGQRLGFSISELQRASPEVHPLGAEGDRVDIALEGRDFIVFIEVKIDAALQKEQLARYAIAARQVAILRERSHHGVIFLSSYAAELPDQAIHAAWPQVASGIRECASQLSPGPATSAAMHFADHISRFWKKKT